MGCTLVNFKPHEPGARSPFAPSCLPQALLARPHPPARPLEAPQSPWRRSGVSGAGPAAAAAAVKSWSAARRVLTCARPRGADARAAYQLLDGPTSWRRAQPPACWRAGASAEMAALRAPAALCRLNALRSLVRMPHPSHSPPPTGHAPDAPSPDGLVFLLGLGVSHAPMHGAWRPCPPSPRTACAASAAPCMHAIACMHAAWERSPPRMRCSRTRHTQNTLSRPQAGAALVRAAHRLLACRRRRGRCGAHALGRSTAASGGDDA